MYIVIAILAFGIIIADHEFGHFIAAKASGVKVNEFAIGMGPTILKKQGKETTYALRLLPIGGFCSMEGEDGDSEDGRAFSSQAAWKRLIILVAGAAMNFLLGFLIVLLLYINTSAFPSNRISEIVDGFKYAENGLQVGDEIYSVDGYRVRYTGDFQTYLNLAGDTVDIVVIRDGEKVSLVDYPLQPEYYIEDGVETYRYGLTFDYVSANLWGRVKYSWNESVGFVKLVWISLKGLLNGTYGLSDMSGVVGVVSTINEVAEESESSKEALQNVAYLCAFIAVNLAVMNMLPVPALDGGRVLFLIIYWVAERAFHKKIDPKYEGYINTVCLILLMVLMIVIMFSDIFKIVK